MNRSVVAAAFSPTRWRSDLSSQSVATDAEFRDAIATLCEDESERRRVGENAVATTERFTLDAVGDQLVTLYDELVSGPTNERTPTN